MGLILKPNGEKATPDRPMLSTGLWEKKLVKEMSIESEFVMMARISDLRRSCGVESKGGDRVKIGYSKL